MKKRVLAGIFLAVVLCMSFVMGAFADTAEEAPDYSVLGKYKEHGYVNDYFGFELTLPSEFLLKSRGLLQLDTEDVVEESNKEDTLKWLNSMLALSSAVVFEADNGLTFVTISLENPGFMNDHWDEEKVVAENSVDTIVEALNELNNDSTAVTGIETSVVEVEDFAGKNHAAISYVYQVNNIPVNGLHLLIRSEDTKNLAIVNIESLVEKDIENVCNLFTEIKEK